MIFFVVIAAIVAMTTFVQRSLESRIHDARNFMITSVMNSDVCDANCVAATGNAIHYEYEPYFSISVSDVNQSSSENHGETSGNAQVLGAIFYKYGNETTTASSNSIQLPPCASGNAESCYSGSN